MSDIRVHTSDIRMTYEHTQVTYECHTSTYSDIRMTHEYIQVTYKWHANDMRMTEEILNRIKYLKALDRNFQNCLW